MKLAFARAGLWFFGAFVVSFFGIANTFTEKEIDETPDIALRLFLVCLLIAWVVGGIAFFIGWYCHELDEKELSDKKRAQALEEEGTDAEGREKD